MNRQSGGGGSHGAVHASDAEQSGQASGSGGRLALKEAGAIDAAVEQLTKGRVRGLDQEAPAPDAYVTAIRRLPSVPAAFAAFPEPLNRRVCDTLRDRGITQLYTHQAEAIAHSLAGRNVVVTTPTASGKTLCYNAPVLDAVLRD